MSIGHIRQTFQQAAAHAAEALGDGALHHLELLFMIRLPKAFSISARPDRSDSPVHFFFAVTSEGVTRLGRAFRLNREFIDMMVTPFRLQAVRR